jgi:hypothetical protein
MFDVSQAFAPSKWKIVTTIVLLLTAWFVGLALLSLVYSDPRFSLLWFVGIIGYTLFDFGFSIGIMLDSFLVSLVLESLYVYTLVSLVAYFLERRSAFRQEAETKEKGAP